MVALFFPNLCHSFCYHFTVFDGIAGRVAQTLGELAGAVEKVQEANQAPTAASLLDLRVAGAEGNDSAQLALLRQKEANQQARQIKTSPGHERLLGFGAGGAVGCGLSTSINRSASPGFSRIVPKSMRHIRESRCLAIVKSA